MMWSESDMAAYLKRHFGGSAFAKSKPAIEELEALLSDEEFAPIEILPNGEIRSLGGSGLPVPQKPLTMRENLGGEYAYA